MQRLAFAGLLSWIALGCSSFDTTRQPILEGTLGEEVVRVFCERMASDAHPEDVSGLAWKPVCSGDVPPPADAPARLRALMAERGRLAGAIDRILPPEVHDDLGHFLEMLLPLYDPPAERLPRNTRLVAALLQTLATDRDALDALSRLGGREGYRPMRLNLGVLRPVLSYPAFDDFAGSAIRALTDDPADPSDGVAAAEWRALSAALALELADLAPADPLPPGELSTLALTRQLLFEDDPAFAGAGPAFWSIARDSRGIALPAAGLVVPPFADADGDWLADVDPLSRFVDLGGTLVDVPHPFRTRAEGAIPRDSGGRALRQDGTRYYEYRDADRTLLAAVLREAPPLFDPMHPTAANLGHGIQAILGPETTLSHTYGAAALSYPGPDTARGSLFDVVHALTQILPRDEVDRALLLTEMLLRDHPDEVAGLLGAGHTMIAAGDSYPDARLAQPNVFWDEMTEMAIDWAQQPGLLDAMLRSFVDSRSGQLGEIYGELMRHRDRIDFDPVSPNADPIGFPLDEPVDRTMADVQGNESLFQRTVALIDGLNGVRVCNKDGAVLRLQWGPATIRWPLIGTARACEIIDIPNVAEAYALSILGRYTLALQDPVLNAITTFASSAGVPVDVLLQQSSGIDGLSRQPTPQALNRLVFWGLAPNPATGQPNSAFCGDLFDRVRDRHGNDVIDTYGGTIFAWEEPGFYAGMTPMLEVLHDPRWAHAADGTYRFGDMIARLHRHWASPGHWLTQSTAPGTPNFSYQDDARSYEEIIARGFADPDGRIIRHMQRLQAVVAGTTVTPGRDGVRVLAELARSLVDPALNPGMTTRDGRTSIPWNEGPNAFDVTPVQLFLDAFRAMDRDLAAAPERRTSWEAARDRLARQFLSADPLGEGWRLSDPRAHAILLHALPWIRARLAEHRTRGDLDAWAADRLPRSEETLGGPLASGILRLLGRLHDDPAAQDALVRLVGYLVDESSPNDAFLATLLAGTDTVQLLEDDRNIVPLAHALSAALAPNARALVDGSATGAPDVDGSVATDALGLVRAIHDADDRHTLAVLLANAVRLPDGGEEVTPLEEILDVMSIINRAEPGQPGPYVADDFSAAMGQARSFMTDERRGLERLFDVVQNRELP